MRLKVTMFVMTVAVLFAGVAFAIPKGHAPLVFKNKMGNVTFTWQMHLNHGLSCPDCHVNLKPKTFTMQFGADKFTMQDIFAGKYCGACHKAGGRAFAPQGHCMNCHNNGSKLVNGELPK
ncbi:MAG: cytochrome C [Actinomycetota bacterium]|nr:cytochrome C [Actinomycetota bacterium]MDA8173738.1 hypothetical protein [Nitrospiraceae bacterium]